MIIAKNDAYKFKTVKIAQIVRTIKNERNREALSGNLDYSARIKQVKGNLKKF